MRTGCSYARTSMWIAVIVWIALCGAMAAATATVTASSSPLRSAAEPSASAQQDSAAAKVATTLQATWVSLSADPSPTDGVPAPRCDHALRSLSGHSRRPNAAVPPVAGSSADPFADQLWLYGGWNEAEEFGDSWTLDVAADPPKWSRIEYSADSDPDAVHSRWGTPIAFLPDGVDSRDAGHGLTALLFGGYSDATYFGDITSFNFNSSTFRTIEPQPAAITDAVPFPRGYTQWIQLPVGFGEGAEALAAGGGVDSGCFYLLGGNGAGDGVRNGLADIDWNDEWVFNLTARSWQRLRSQQCLANVTSCSDEQSLLTLLADALNSTAAEGAEPLDLTAPIRPADIGPTLERLAAAVAALNATAAGMENDPASCQTSCAQYAEANSSVLRPPPLEGTRMVTVGTKLFLFGGYSCSERGVQEKGGEACFLGSMWVLDYADMTWSRIDPPDSSDPGFKNWPSRRCFNTLVGHEGRGLVVVQGGFFQDSSGVAYYYSDSYAFDVARMDFVPFTVRGIPPLVAWSAAAALRGDDMFLHGGCQGGLFYDQLLVLRIGLAIEAGNCFASGAGLRSATAGAAASFTIQTLETKFSSPTDLSSANVTRAAWGANATYGTGLVFSAQLVTTSRGGAVSLMQAEVTERVNGSYLVSYTASAGHEFQLFVSLDGAQIPGSPFSLRVAPQPVAAPERSAASGWGVALVEKGAPAALRLQLADAFGNEFADNSFLPAGAAEARSQTGLVSWIGPDGGSVLNVSAALGPDADLVRPLDFSLLNHQNGSLSLRYAAPADNPAFLLAVRVNGAHISGSPFTVSALDPVELGSPVVAALCALSALVMLVCVVSAALVARFNQAAVMRSSSPTFLYVLMAGSALSALSVVFLAIEGSDRACQAFHTLLSVGLVLGMAALLAKSHRVMRIFTARKLRVPSNLSDARLMVPTLGTALLVLLLNLLWIGLDPLRSELRPSAAHPAVLSFHSCASAHGQSWVAALLAVCGAVLLYGVYIAVSTGHVPEQFNESKLIAASVYNVFFCSLIVVPLLFFLGSSSDFLVGRVVLQAIVILWCSSFPVLALMAPKLLLLWKAREAANGPGGAKALEERRGQTVLSGIASAMSDSKSGILGATPAGLGGGGAGAAQRLGYGPRTSINLGSQHPHQNQNQQQHRANMATGGTAGAGGVMVSSIALGTLQENGSNSRRTSLVSAGTTVTTTTPQDSSRAATAAADAAGAPLERADSPSPPPGLAGPGSASARHGRSPSGGSLASLATARAHRPPSFVAAHQARRGSGVALLGLHPPATAQPTSIEMTMLSAAAVAAAAAISGAAMPTVSEGGSEASPSPLDTSSGYRARSHSGGAVSPAPSPSPVAEAAEAGLASPSAAAGLDGEPNESAAAASPSGGGDGRPEAEVEAEAAVEAAAGTGANVAAASIASSRSRNGSFVSRAHSHTHSRSVTPVPGAGAGAGAPLAPLAVSPGTPVSSSYSQFGGGAASPSVSASGHGRRRLHVNRPPSYVHVAPFDLAATAGETSQAQAQSQPLQQSAPSAAALAALSIPTPTAATVASAAAEAAAANGSAPPAAHPDLARGTTPSGQLPGTLSRPASVPRVSRVPSVSSNRASDSGNGGGSGVSTPVHAGKRRITVHHHSAQTPAPP